MKNKLKLDRDKLKVLAKWAIVAAGCAIFANGLLVLAFSNFSLGIVLTVFLGCAVAALGLFIHKIPKIIRVTASLILAVIIVFSSVLMVSGKSDNVTYEEDAVIVLGAGIHGERLSLTLKNRLDAALRYYEINPNAVIVVSGGRGPQEDITEALAMERYLISQGVDPRNIIKEERSTSTAENFRYSAKLLDEYFEGDYTVAYVTDDFHIYRAGKYASMAGISAAHHIHSDIKWYMTVPNCLREMLAVIKLWVMRK